LRIRHELSHDCRRDRPVDLSSSATTGLRAAVAGLLRGDSWSEKLRDEPAWLAQALEKATTEVYQDRYRQAGELGSALQATQEGVTAVRRAARQQEKNRRDSSGLWTWSRLPKRRCSRIAGRKPLTIAILSWLRPPIIEMPPTCERRQSTGNDA